MTEQTIGIAAVDFEARFRLIELQLEQIAERNRRVELQKRWEISLTRTLGIAAITYVSVTGVLWFIGAPRPAVNACIPVIGYFLSTQSLPLLQRAWERSIGRARTRNQMD